jgi:predicted Abi (CAAX) family protease
MFETINHDLALTLGGLLICALGGVLTFRRHFIPGRNYRRINWMVVCLAFVSVSFILLVHLVNIAGFETGNR